MGNPIQMLPIDINALRNVVALKGQQAPNVPNVPTDQYANAIQGLQNYSDKIQQLYPTEQSYHPSKLRRILGDAAGILYGGVSLNPVVGMSMSNAIKNWPMRQAIQRYQRDVYPYSMQAQLGLDQAKVQGLSAQQIYNYMKTAADVANSRTNLLKVLKPNVSRSVTYQPNQNAPARVGTIESGIDPNTYQPYEHLNELGFSPVSTPNERKELLGEKLAGQMAIEARREVAANRRAGMTRQAAEGKAKSTLISKKINISDPNLVWSALNPNEQKSIMSEVGQYYPNLLKSVKDKNGNVFYTLKSSAELSPEERMQLKQYQKYRAMQRAVEHNYAIDEAINALGDEGSYSIVNEEEPQ